VVAAERSHPAPEAAGPAGGVKQFWDVPRALTLACDVVVVGSGAGGATVAAEVAEAGRSVIVLEEGGFHDTRSFHTDALRSIMDLYREAGAQRVAGRPEVMLAQGRCVGGSTVINGGMCWRTPERALRRWRWEHGIEGASLEALEPFFRRVEERLHVAVQSPESIGRDDDLLRIGAERLGYKVTPNTRNQRHCVGSNNCAFGCPTGGKQSMLVSYLPRAVAHGAEIYADCRVSRVLTERTPGGKPRAVGVAGRLVDPATGRAGPRIEVRAKRVVLACGATETPVLLLENRLANSSGQVGRNFTLHPNGKCVAIYDEDVHGWRGVHQAHQVHEFLAEGLDMAVAFVPPELLALSLPLLGDELWDVISNVNRLVTCGVLVEDTTSGRVLPGPGGIARMSYRMTEHDVRQLLRGIGLLAECMFASGAKRIVTPVHGAPELRSPDDIPRLLGAAIDPRDIEVLSVHPMGTCRMGADPRRSVVGSYGEAHDVSGLYIADASVLATPIGVNPMETIVALATRTAFRMLDGL
jgi:choline dehydrogenase-like flavoprotein